MGRDKKIVCLIMILLLIFSLPLFSAGKQEKVEKVSIVFGGVVDPALFGLLVEMFEEENPGVSVDMVTADRTIREQILKTGISVGDPVDVGNYWGTRLNAFYNLDMCMDLSDYIPVGSSWRNIMLEPMLAPTTDIDGKIYGIPVSAVYHGVFYNKDMLEEYGFALPETWADMTAIFERLKKDDIFGFTTNSESMQDAIYGLTYPLFEEIAPGNALAAAQGKRSFINTREGEVVREVIEQFVEWYDNGYWYPGEGGINTSAEAANAGFAQERAMFIFNHSGAYAHHLKSCDFEVGFMSNPVRRPGMSPYNNLETHVNFIPINVSEDNIDAALKLVEFMTGKEAQQLVADRGVMPVTTHDLEIGEVLQGMLDTVSSGIILPGINPCSMSSRMQSFIKQEVISGPAGRTRTIGDTLIEMEKIRLAD